LFEYPLSLVLLLQRLVLKNNENFLKEGKGKLLWMSKWHKLEDRVLTAFLIIFFNQETRKNE